MGGQYKAQSPQLDWRASVSQRRTWLPSLLIGVVAGLGGIAEFILNRGVAIFLILIAVALAVFLVEPDRCRGRAVRIFNQRFWARQGREAETDQSPPRGVEARLYTDDDLQSEVDALEWEAPTSLEINNG